VDAVTSGQTKLEAFEMRIWRRMERISCMVKVTNEDELKKVNEDNKNTEYFGRVTF